MGVKLGQIADVVSRYVCVSCVLYRLQCVTKASSVELKLMTDMFRTEQNYERAYRRLIRADCVAAYIAAKSKQQMSAVKEHVRSIQYTLSASL